MRFSRSRSRFHSLALRSPSPIFNAILQLDATPLKSPDFPVSRLAFVGRHFFHFANLAATGGKKQKTTKQTERPPFRLGNVAATDDNKSKKDEADRKTALPLGQRRRDGRQQKQKRRSRPKDRPSVWQRRRDGRQETQKRRSRAKQLRRF